MSAETFTVSITLGNDTMRTHDDVAGALQTIVDRFAGRDDEFTAEHIGLTFAIRDANGNTVGHFQVA